MRQAQPRAGSVSERPVLLCDVTVPLLLCDVRVTVPLLFCDVRVTVPLLLCDVRVTVLLLLCDVRVTLPLLLCDVTVPLLLCDVRVTVPLLLCDVRVTVPLLLCDVKVTVPLSPNGGRRGGPTWDKRATASVQRPAYFSRLICPVALNTEPSSGANRPPRRPRQPCARSALDRRAPIAAIAGRLIELEPLERCTKSTR